MRKMDSSKMELTQGFQCLGHSKWTICSLLSQFCLENFPTLNFYTGECQFLITPCNWKWEKLIHQNIPIKSLAWEQEIHPQLNWFKSWDFQSWAFSACYAYFPFLKIIPEIFHLSRSSDTCTLLDIKTRFEVDPARRALWAARDQPRTLFIWPA